MRPGRVAARQQLPARDPLDEPSLTSPDTWPDSQNLMDWDLLPTKPDWATGFGKAWEVGEAAAHERLDAFAIKYPYLTAEQRHLAYGQPRQEIHRLAG